MRFFSVLPLLSLLLGTRASSLDSRAPASSHRHHAHDPLIDVCVTLNVELNVPSTNPILSDRGLDSSAVGLIDACICLSALPLFLEANVVALAAVQIAGETVVTDILAKLIIDEAASSGCVFPEHSQPACVEGQPKCGFTCTDGFEPSLESNPPACVCPPPSVVCNGQCKENGPCPSAGAASALKKRWAGSATCSERGPGWATCGVYGGGRHAWECVNTARDLESCGGCAVPLTPYSPIGKDCSALYGVADVACLYGECVVYRCLPGYEPANDGHSCVRKYSQFDEEEAVLANVYGLEPVPVGHGH